LLSLAAGTIAAVAATCALQNEDVPRLEEHMFERVNAEREARGLGRLEWIPTLSIAARALSATMAREGALTHEPRGETVQERLKPLAPHACLFGENISKHISVEYALSDLLASPGHRGNVLHPDYSGIGVGIVRDETGALYITQDFIGNCPSQEKRREARRPPR
jgi:uncharacterized protein YkwD